LESNYAFSNVEGFNDIIRDVKQIFICSVKDVESQVPVQVCALDFSPACKVVVRND